MLAEGVVDAVAFAAACLVDGELFAAAFFVTGERKGGDTGGPSPATLAAERRG